MQICVHKIGGGTVIDCIVADVLDKYKPNLDTFLKGVAAKENKEPYSPYPWYDNWPYRYNSVAIYAPEDLYARCLNNERVAKLLFNISKQKHIKELIPGYIYHKVLLKGSGNAATRKIKRATFHFSLYEDNGSFLEAGTILEVELNKLAPGIAYSIVGMQRGEEREIYMHPNYVYGHADASVLLHKTHLRLLDFEEGDEEVNFPPVNKDIVSTENIDKFKEEYKKIMESRNFGAGYYFWQTIKNHDIQITAAEFSKLLKSEYESQSFSSANERSQFIFNYNRYLFSKEIDQIDPQKLFDF